MSKLIDQLLSDGIEMGSFIVKAQLNPSVRDDDTHLPAVQDIIDQVMSEVDEHYAAMADEISEVLRNVDARKALGLYVIDGGLQGDDLFKAKLPGNKPAKPPTMNITGKPRAKPGQASGKTERKPMDSSRAGTRGGKWYLDEKGHVRYGTKPTHIDTRELAPEEVQAQLSHFRPTPFMGTHGADKILVDHLLSNAKALGFSEDEAAYLNAWFGSKNPATGEYKDGLVNTFLADYGEDEDTIQGDLSKPFSHDVHTNGEEVSYQEAVLSFFRTQDYVDEEGNVADFENDILPHLDSIHKKFEALKMNPAMAATMEKVAQYAMEKRSETLNFKLDDTDTAMKNFSDVVTSMANPVEKAQHLAAGLAALDLIFIPTKGETNQAAHLKGSITPNLTYTANTDFFHENTALYDKMNVSQLMATLVGANLASSWDHENREIITGVGDSENPTFPSSPIGEEAFKRLRSKLGLSTWQASVLREQINSASMVLAYQINAANHGGDPLFKEFVRNGTEIIHNPSKMDEIRKKHAEAMELRQNALDAMKNDTFELPKSMAEGEIGGEHQKTPQPHQLIDKDDPSKGTKGLFRHQKQAINWMLAVKRGVLALDAGMGKTNTVITFMEHLKAQGKGQKAILFLPPSLMNQWPNDIAAVAPDMKSKILNLSGLSLEERKEALKSDMAKNAEYILISTGTLNSGGDQGEAHESENDGTGGSDNEMVELLKGLDGAMFIDEVHQGGYKSADTVRHKIARQVLGDREYAFGMTATPMPNHPIDLFNITDMFAQGAVGTRDEWEGSLHGVAYDSMTDKWAIANPKNLTELRERLAPFVMHKLITDEEVRSDPAFAKMLPPDPVTHDEHVEISEDHPMHAYIRPGGHIDNMVEANIDQLEEDRGEPYNPKTRALLTKMLAVKYHRLCNISPKLIDPKYTGRSPKIDRMVGDIVDHFKGGGGKEDKPLVIFCSYPGKAFPLLRQRLAEEGIDPSLVGEIHGGKSSIERGFEQDMTNQGKRKILLVGTMSGGAGLNLQKKANKMMFLDEPWHPSAKRQALGRVWRTGQKDTSTVHNYRVTFPGGQSWDEKVAEKLAGKQAMVSAFLAPSFDITSPEFAAVIDTNIKNLLGTSGAATAKHSGKKKKSKASVYGQLLASLNDSIDSEDMPSVNGNEDEIADIDEQFDNEYAKYHDKKKQKELGKTAPNIANALDEGSERRRWNRDLQIRNAKNTWQLKQTLQKVYESAGDVKKRDKAEAGVRKVVENYRSWAKEIATEAVQHHEAGRTEEAKAAEKAAAQMQKDFPEAFQKQPWDVKDPVEKKPGKETKQALAAATKPAAKEKEKPAAKEKEKPAAKEKEKPAAKPAAKETAKPAKKAAVLKHDTSPFEGKKKLADEHKFWSIINAAGAKTTKDAREALRPHIKKQYSAEMKKHKLSADDIIDQVMAHLKSLKAL